MPEQKKTILFVFSIALGLVNIYCDIFDPRGNYDKSNQNDRIIGDIFFGLLFFIVPSLFAIPAFNLRNNFSFYLLIWLAIIWNFLLLILYYQD